MNHIIKNNKWVIGMSLTSILFGTLTFFTFINQSFLELNNLNLQILLLVDALLLITLFIIIFRKIYKILINKKKGKSGSETSFKYVIFFSTTALIPSILIAIFSLFLFNVVIQKYFEKQIKTVVNTSAEVAKNYVEETKKSIQADILLIINDLNSKSSLYYVYPNQFLKVLTTQRLLRRLDEIYLLDSSGNIIMSNVANVNFEFVPPPDEAFARTLNGIPVRITDPATNRISALVKLDSFIDTYLYIARFMEPRVINYLKQSNEAISFYYSVQNQKTGIKITFAVIYVLIVSLLLFLSVTIAINFASRLTKPIINLISASEKISLGNLDAQVPNIDVDKEFEMLNKNFNLMIKKLKQQQVKLLFTERHKAWENVAKKLAHEIKNPLTPIQLSIDRIKEKYFDKIGDDKENFLNYLNTINKQIKDIESLLNEFSNFARMPKPLFRKVDLNNMLLRSISLHELSEPKINFVFLKTPIPFQLNCDEEQFNRVFVNLIKNSIESIKEKNEKIVDFKGKINIEITSDSAYIYVNIIDNGMGFDHVDKDKMITPYFTTKKKGTGLGLAVVSKIISDHNSEILFNSIKSGAKVEIKIPKIS